MISAPHAPDAHPRKQCVGWPCGRRCSLHVDSRQGYGEEVIRQFVVREAVAWPA